MIYVAECKGGAQPPPPRKPPVPSDAAQSGQNQFNALRRKNRGFLSTILTGSGGNDDMGSLLGS